MDLKDRVCNWELAKRLKELGEPQDGLWWWGELVDTKEKTLFFHNELFKEKDGQDAVISMTYPTLYYSAPTVAELGERLPKKIFSFLNHLKKWRIGEVINYCGYKELNFISDSNTEANARAKMRIYLLENKLIEKR